MTGLYYSVMNCHGFQINELKIVQGSKPLKVRYYTTFLQPDIWKYWLKYQVWISGSSTHTKLPIFHTNRRTSCVCIEIFNWIFDSGHTVPLCQILKISSHEANIQIQIMFLHYNVLHGQTKFNPSYGNPQ